jgi:trimeric autotransporter adhesin
MKFKHYKILFFLSAIFGVYSSQAQAPANDNCANAIALTSNIVAVQTSGTLNNSTQSPGIATSASSCVSWSNAYDVWYKFTATQTNHTVTTSAFGPNYWNREFQVYDGINTTGVCPTVTTGWVACGSNGVNSVSFNTTVGRVYFIRVSDSWTALTSGGEFNIAVTHRQFASANATCGINSFQLTHTSSCTSFLSNLRGVGSSTPVGACGSPTNTYAGWYKFTAASTSVIVTLSNLGTAFTTNTPYVQLLSEGTTTCSSLTSLACQDANANRVLDYTGLTIGKVYYVRVYTTANPNTGALADWDYSICVTNPIIVGGRTGEVFKQTSLISPNTIGTSNRLSDPWEITYGPDDSLWVTEAKGYKVKKVHPGNGGQRTVLDLSDGSSFTPASFKRTFTRAQSPWPQGGMMGLAIHPDYNATTPKKFVYLAYVKDYITPTTTTPTITSTNPRTGEVVNGYLFTTSLVRFTYNGSSLVSPVAMCDTIVGSNDHNSGRLIIKPEAGVNYLFYAMGDLGAGQFDNAARIMKAQQINSYEGKILRFNLEADADAGALDKWIPDNNPFNATLGVQSAVWSTGMRNNQGFAYNAEQDILYGSSHGPFSDDELNVIEGNKNYGHPLVVGYSADGNYNNAKAGGAGGSLPLITSETTNVTTINTNGAATGTTYKDPFFSYYAAPAGNNSTPWSIQYIYNNIAGSQGQNGSWQSEGISGLEIYSKPAIPGWRNSLLNAALKGGRILRNKMNAAGTGIVPIEGADTATYFRGVNRFRDLAIAPNGRDIFAVIDSSSSTSGPTTANPVVSACRGCLQRYTFLGYNDASGASSISTNIPIAPGKNNALTTLTSVNINNADNNNLWVPITDSLGNIIAEIDANGNNLGNVTGTLYKNTSSIRVTSLNKSYLDRSITINVQNQPAAGNPVNVRFYITAAELATLVASPLSSVANINGLHIQKNNDANASALTSAPTAITPTRATFGTNHVLTASVSSFSSFYFMAAGSVVSADDIALKGEFVSNGSALNWQTSNEQNASHFVVERSINGTTFTGIQEAAANGNTPGLSNYSYLDKDAEAQNVHILYYRIKLVSLDGKIMYSNTVAIRLNGKNNFISLAPNPASTEIKAQLTANIAQQATYKVYDNSGRVVLNGNFYARKGLNVLPININALSSGMYIIQFAGTTISGESRFQKIN